VRRGGYFGRIVRSAISRSWRAIATGSSVRTSRAASRRTFVLCGADLALDDVDRQVLPAQQAGDAIPDALSAGVGVHNLSRGAATPALLRRRRLTFRSGSGRVARRVFPWAAPLGGFRFFFGLGSSSGIGFVMPARWGNRSARSTPIKSYTH
jgi:hypothetical protein